MDEIKIKNIFAAVSDKSILDPLLGSDLPKGLTLSKTFKNGVHFWGTEGTVKYLKSQGFSAHSVVVGFDFDGRVKTLDKSVFVRILADRTKQRHLSELRSVIARSPSISLRATKQSKKRSLRFARDDRDAAPFDLVIVELYQTDPNSFPESMDIGGQALIRAAIKNYQNVALAFDEKSLSDLVRHMRANQGSTMLSFRINQAKAAAEFIATRCKMEARLFFS